MDGSFLSSPQYGVSSEFSHVTYDISRRHCHGTCVYSTWHNLIECALAKTQDKLEDYDSEFRDVNLLDYSHRCRVSFRLARCLRNL